MARHRSYSIEMRCGISRNCAPPACRHSGTSRIGPAYPSLDGWNLATNAQAVIAGPEVRRLNCRQLGATPSEQTESRAYELRHSHVSRKSPSRPPNIPCTSSTTVSARSHRLSSSSGGSCSARSLSISSAFSYRSCV